MPWLLLIDSVPSGPLRLRATIWRELNKAGTVYADSQAKIATPLPKKGLPGCGIAALWPSA